MNHRFTVLLWAVLLLAASAVRAQHEHLNAGASGTLSGSQLQLADADAFLAGSGYVWQTTFQPGGYFPGLYATVDITFTSLAATPFYGGPEPGHAAVGANLKMQIVSVTGPAGGVFGYWEGGDYFTETTPTARFNTGSAAPVAYTDNALSSYTGGFWTFNLTQAAPSDPFGHVHDRGYSFTTGGNYQVGFRITDSTGFHTNSSTYTLAFNVVPEPSAGLLGAAGAGLTLLRRRRRKGPA